MFLRYFQNTRNKSLLSFRWGSDGDTWSFRIICVQLSTELHGCFASKEQQCGAIHVFVALPEAMMLWTRIEAQWSTNLSYFARQICLIASHTHAFLIVFWYQFPLMQPVKPFMQHLHATAQARHTSLLSLATPWRLCRHSNCCHVWFCPVQLLLGNLAAKTKTPNGEVVGSQASKMFEMCVSD